MKSLRFDENNYFWINDMQPRMIMHPLNENLVGKDLSREKDPDGKAMFVEMVDLCRKEGQGFVEYVWQKPGSEKPVDKISFVKKVPQWNWIVGAGVYTDDIQKSLNRIFYGTLIVLLALIAGAAAVTLLVSRQICLPLAQAVDAMEKLGSGNFDVHLGLNRKDEIGRIAGAFDKSVVSLRDIFVDVRSMGVRIASNSVRLIRQVDVSPTTPSSRAKSLTTSSPAARRRPQPMAKSPTTPSTSALRPATTWTKPSPPSRNSWTSTAT